MARLAAIALVALLVVACSDDEPEPAATRSTRTTTTTIDDPTDRLFRYEPEDGTVVTRSLELVGGDPTIALVGVANDDGTSRVIVLDIYDETRELAEVPLPSFDLTPDFSIKPLDVTGDGRPDYLVNLLAADNVPGVVVSDDGGTWRLLRVAGGADGVVLGRDATFTSGYLRSFDNDCTPSCAEGTTTMATWSYDRPTDTLRRSDGDDTCSGRERSIEGDVDGDGRTDTIWQDFVGTENRLGVCTATGIETWVSAGGEGELRSVDINEDGRTEIVAGGTSVSQVISDLIVLVGDELRVVHGVGLSEGPTSVDDDDVPARFQQWGCEAHQLVVLDATRTADGADVHREVYELHDDEATKVVDEVIEIDHMLTYGERRVPPC